MTEALINQIADRFGLTDVRIGSMQGGYRNQTFPLTTPAGAILNLIIYKREEGILERVKNANYVANALAAAGLPARRTADPRLLQLKGERGTTYAALYTYLPGSTIPWEGYTMEHLKQLGGTMSTMHALLQLLKQENLPHVIDESRALLKRIEKYFADEGVHDALAGKLGLAVLDTTRLRPAIDETLQLPAQALHMDFVRGNILFEGTAISGILDFEKTAWGSTVFDIARTLAFLLVDCKYKEEAKIRKYFLQSGYNKRGQNRFEASPLLEDLVNFFLLHDFYKFLRHNPYESLLKNEHFIRTRDFLLKRNIIARTEMLQ